MILFTVVPLHDRAEGVPAPDLGDEGINGVHLGGEGPGILHHLGSPWPNFSPGHKELIAVSKLSGSEYWVRPADRASFCIMFM